MIRVHVVQAEALKNTVSDGEELRDEVWIDKIFVLNSQLLAIVLTPKDTSAHRWLGLWKTTGFCFRQLRQDEFLDLDIIDCLSFDTLWQTGTDAFIAR